VRKFTRREFLNAAGKGLIATQLLKVLPADAIPAHGQSFPLAVVVEGSNEDTPEVILTSALAAIGGIERFVRPGMTVAIKPNATWAYPPHTGSSSDPDLLRALINMVKKAKADRIIVMDHCSIDPGTAEALRVSGIGSLVKEEGVEGVFPDRTNAPLSTYQMLDFPNGKAFKKLGVIKAAFEADVRINLAMAKTHNVTKMSMSLKHMMGFLQSPGSLHSKLEQGISDLSAQSPIQAHLHILEALRVRLPYGSYRVCAGPETDITNPKVVRRYNQIIVGTDPVLMDSYGCIQFFDMQPEELPYIVNAFEAGVGEMNVQAALQDGRLKVFGVGKAVPTSSPTALITTPTPQSAVGGNPTILGTATPMPTATALPDGTAIQPIGINLNTGVSCSNEVIDPRPFLDKAMLPVAGIVLGTGLVAISQLNRNSDNPKVETKEKEHGEEE
jgi:hypothetical protein